jgi:outer membrane immunogenic protein
MKFPVAIVMALFGVASAQAADLAARTYTKAPVYVDPGYNWTGFYIGGNVGYSWGKSRDTSTITNGAGTALFSSSGGSNLDGVVGGGQIGYNWQMQGWVWGLEADIQGTDEKGSRGFTCPTGVCTPSTTTTVPGFFAAAPPVIVTPGAAVPVSLNQKIDWFGTVRGRIGFLAAPKVLLYATGGLAYGEVDSSATIAGVGFPTTNSTKAGYTVGAGVEGVIGGNWTAKLEYLYVDLGKMSGSFATTTAAFGGGVLASNFSSRVTDNILRVGVNYKFSGPGGAGY